MHKYVALFFYSRMHVKDASISRYPEWDDYSKRSNRLIPWKMLTAPFGRGNPGQSTTA